MISKGNRKLDEFHRKIERSHAYTVWFYNLLISNGGILRSVGAPSFNEKKRAVVDVLNKVRLRPDSVDAKIVSLCNNAEENIDTWSLKDSDIAWIHRLEPNELFTIWFYVRHAESSLPLYAQNDTNLRNLTLPEFLKSKILESEAVPNSHYDRLHLPAHPETNDEMKSCLTDFAVSWDGYLFNKINALKRLQHIRNGVKTLKIFDFLKKCSNEEVDLVWRYLRDRKEMVGQSCEEMSSFGVARVVGVYCNWQISPEVKERALKAAKAYIEDRRSKAQSNVVKMNLTLSESSRDRLIELAGGKRKVSAYVEDLIKNL